MLCTRRDHEYGWEEAGDAPILYAACVPCIIKTIDGKLGGISTTLCAYESLQV